MVTAPISVVIATIPPRADLLTRAIRSVHHQTLQPEALVIEPDPDHTGAAATKNRGIERVTTEWTAMLDDDDQFLKHHLETLYDAALSTNAHVVYSVPLIPNNPSFVASEPQYFKPFSADVLRERSYIQTTSLINTDLLKSVGGFQCPPGSVYDDWGLWLACLDAGATFFHVPQQTFIWSHRSPGRPGFEGNTSGRSDRW